MELKHKIFTILFIYLISYNYVIGQTQYINEWINPKDGMVYIKVPRGKISVKIQDYKGTSIDELPLSEVLVKEFWMSETEVTVGQFKKFVSETGYVSDAEEKGYKWNWRNPGYVQEDDHPVVFISFRDAKSYTNWAGTDLPDEVEWLYACSAGTLTKYYWGDDMKPELFWHRENSLEGTHPVGTNQPNPLGFYDMMGNVKEYCRIIGGGYGLRGESFARCISYKHKSGFTANNMVAESVSKVLHFYNPNSRIQPNPWDDDSGFRCVRRVN